MAEIIGLSEESIKKKYQKITWGMLLDLAEYLDEIGFPSEKRIAFKGESASKVEKKEMWLYYDEDGDPKLQTNLVPDKPDNMYFKDLMNPEFIIDVRDSIVAAVYTWKQYKEVDEWVEAGKRCVFRYGWAYKGAGCRDVSQEEARRLSKKHSFGKGFYTMSWIEIDGERVLEFNELSENDMW